jgi:hypothetical protein
MLHVRLHYPDRISFDVPGIYLACTSHVPGRVRPPAPAAGREGSAGPQLEPGQRPAPPPGGQPPTSPGPRPSSASPSDARSRGTPPAPRSVTSTRTTPSAAQTATMPLSPAAPEPLCRTLFPDSSLTSSVASSPHRCHGPSTPTVNARATRARSGPRPSSRSPGPPWPSAHPPFPPTPGEPPGRRADAPVHAQLGGPRQA